MDNQLNYLLASSVEAIRQSHFDAAEKLLSQALLISPRHPDALRFMSVIAAFREDWELALQFINQALKLNPENGIAFSNKGYILRGLGLHQDALECFDKAIALAPDYAEAHNNKGNIFQDLSRFEDALACYDKAIALAPDYAQAHSNKGNAMRALGRFLDAIPCYENALKIMPTLKDAFLGAGHAFFHLRQYPNSLFCYDRALLVDEKNISAWLCKGDIFYLENNYSQALTCFEKALEYDPNNGAALGMALNSRLQMCDWGGYEGYLKTLMTQIESGAKGISPYAAITLSDNPRFIRDLTASFMQDLNQIEPLPFKDMGRCSEKIHLGYFSADFHNHPTAFLAAGLFERHDKSKFKLTAFVLGKNQPDSMRERLTVAFDELVDVSNLSDKEVAELSRSMSVDIAIDMKGITQDSRPQIFAYRAAPVQVSYLGYPGTMSSSFMDYLVADKTIIPESLQTCYEEKIIYMPNSYQVNDESRAFLKSEQSRLEFGLPENGFVFCCFNNSYKISPSIFSCWLRILFAIEGSVLWLFDGNHSVANNLRAIAKQNNVDPARLIFAKRMEQTEHLARYQLADLFLDTFPCNAHTTASDALWAGVPILTIQGNSFSARVGASLLNAIGLPELAVSNEDEYEALAKELAKNPYKLCNIKNRLDINKSTHPLFNTSLFARHLENAYIQIFERCRSRLGPEHIYINTYE
jgi:predicted O-linked N-acetylglucosamine transferase (SPINDLY family)